MSRQKLIHLHGVNTPDASTLTGKGFVAGEIAVKNGAAAKDSELYVLGGDNELAVFATKSAMQSWTSTQIKNATDELSGGAVADLQTNLAALSGSVNTLSGTVSTNYTALDGRLDSVETILGAPANGDVEATGLVKKVNDIETAYKQADNDITEAYKAADSALETAYKAADAAITSAYTEADATTLASAKTYTNEEIAKEVTTRDAAIKVVGDKVTELSGTVASNKSELESQIQAAKAAATTKVVEGTENAHLSITNASAADGSVTYTVTLTDVASEEQLNDVKGKVTTLIGEDANMSARAIVQDEVAKQLTSENITDSFDTLKEMAEWLSAHPEDVQEMNDAISANASAITAEATARQEVDNDLKSKIEAVETKVTGATNDAITAITANITTISGDVATLKSEMDAAESGITANTAAITAETAAREAAISGVTDAYKAADTELSNAIASARTDFAAADTQIRSDYAAADTQIRSDFAAADAATLDSAKTYTDNAITTLTDGKIKQVEDALADVKTTADGAVQTVTVSNLSGVTAARSGADVTIDCKEMVIDCGSWE